MAGCSFGGELLCWDSISREEHLIAESEHVQRKKSSDSAKKRVDDFRRWLGHDYGRYNLTFVSPAHS